MISMRSVEIAIILVQKSCYCLMIASMAIRPAKAVASTKPEMIDTIARMRALFACLVPVVWSPCS